MGCKVVMGLEGENMGWISEGSTLTLECKGIGADVGVTAFVANGKYFLETLHYVKNKLSQLEHGDTYKLYGGDCNPWKHTEKSEVVAC